MTLKTLLNDNPGTKAAVAFAFATTLSIPAILMKPDFEGEVQNRLDGMLYTNPSDVAFEMGDGFTLARNANGDHETCNTERKRDDIVRVNANICTKSYYIDIWDSASHNPNFSRPDLTLFNYEGQPVDLSLGKTISMKGKYGQDVKITANSHDGNLTSVLFSMPLGQKVEDTPTETIAQLSSTYE